MSGSSSRPMILPTIQAVGGLTASLLASAWTLSRWGITETMYGIAPVLLTLTCVCVSLASLVLIAWVGRKWGASNTLRGVTPWLVLAATASMALAGLAVLAATLQTYGLASTVCTLTCLLWLSQFAARHAGQAWKYLHERGTARPVAQPVVVNRLTPWEPSPRAGDGVREWRPVDSGGQRSAVTMMQSHCRVR